MNGEKNNSTTNTQCVTPRKLKFEQLRADYELFLQTFESKMFCCLFIILINFNFDHNLFYISGILRLLHSFP